MAAYVARHGYLEIAVMANSRRQKWRLHQLVARAFVEGYEEGLCVNHIDGNKLNNLPSNLEWVTLARNTQHQWEIGLVNLRGEASPNAKLTSGQVRIIRDLLKMGANCNQLAVLARVDPQTIYGIQSGKKWNHL